MTTQTAQDLGTYAIGETIFYVVESYDEDDVLTAPSRLDTTVTIEGEDPDPYVLGDMEVLAVGRYRLAYIPLVAGPVSFVSEIETVGVVTVEAFALVEGAVALPTRALVTPASVAGSALGSLGQVLYEIANGQKGQDWQALVEAVTDASDLVQSYLRRDLIVKNHRLIFKPLAWRGRHGNTNAAGTSLMTAWPRQWPVLQVINVQGEMEAADFLFLETRQEQAALLAFDPDLAVSSDNPTYLDAFCGYRRRDQNLASLTGATDVSLADLTVLPPLLPQIITSVTNQIALARIRQAALGMTGLSSIRKEVERMTVDAQRPDEDLERKALARLFAFRHMPY